MFYRWRLDCVQWEPTRKGKKPYLSTNSKPPQFPLKKIRSEISKSKYFNSTQHSAKSFADDLSVFSSSIKDHHPLLLAIDDKCSDLDLTLKPEKCVSIVFNGVKMDHTMSFPLKNGSTRNIADAPTKVLSKLIAVSTSQTKSAASSKLEKRFYLPSRRLMNVLSEVNTKFGFGKMILPPLSIFN